jgi:hypothetical protein
MSYIINGSVSRQECESTISPNCEFDDKERRVVFTLKNPQGLPMRNK